MSDGSELFTICFVCTGNICRSPMAEIVMQELVRAGGHDSMIGVLSAGTGDWHVGEPADRRTLQALSSAGYDPSGHRAKQFEPSWLGELDLVITFDRTQDRMISNWSSSIESRAAFQSLLSFDSLSEVGAEVPDPYYSDAAMFDQVLATIERACRALYAQLRPGFPARPAR